MERKLTTTVNLVHDRWYMYKEIKAGIIKTLLPPMSEKEKIYNFKQKEKHLQIFNNKFHDSNCFLCTGKYQCQESSGWKNRQSQSDNVPDIEQKLRPKIMSCFSWKVPFKFFPLKKMKWISFMVLKTINAINVFV